MKPTRFIRTAWDTFKARVLSDAARFSPDELAERAYWDGATAVFNVLMGISPEGEPTAADVRLIEGLHLEIFEYMQARGARECRVCGTFVLPDELAAHFRASHAAPINAA